MKCDECGRETVVLKYRASDLKRGLCPRCFRGDIPIAPLVQFKGTGWTPKES